MEWAKWMFDGIGTQIVIFVLGIIASFICGENYQKRKTVKNKPSQKAGTNAVQIMAAAPNTTTGDYVKGEKITIIENRNEKYVECDIRNFSSYNSEQIENVIRNGNDATRRKWCVELILNNKPQYLIEQCISLMINDREKEKLLIELSEKKHTDSRYFKMICDSLKNAIYITNAIDLAIKNNDSKLVESLYMQIKNDRYAYEALINIYKYDKKLFDTIYSSGKCLTDVTYIEKIEKWIKENTEK